MATSTSCKTKKVRKTPNKAMIRRWINALRSGEYRQGTGRLLGFKSESGECYCCLGVLTHIEGEGEWTFNEYGVGYEVVDDAILGAYVYKSDVTGFLDSTHLPLELKNKLGVPKKILDKLMRMNDAASSFEDIADYLYNQYLKRK